MVTRFTHYGLLHWRTTILLWTKYNGDDDDDDQPSDQLVSLYKLFIFIFSNIPWVIFVFAFIQKSLFLFVYLFICPKCCLYSETPDHTTYNKRIVHYQFISISVCVCVFVCVCVKIRLGIWYFTNSLLIFAMQFFFSEQKKMWRKKKNSPMISTNRFWTRFETYTHTHSNPFNGQTQQTTKNMILSMYGNFYFFRKLEF